jgi:hypothetical protein
VPIAHLMELCERRRIVEIDSGPKAWPWLVERPTVVEPEHDQVYSGAHTAIRQRARARLVSAGCPDLAGVVPLTATFLVQHLPRVLRAFGVSLRVAAFGHTSPTFDARRQLWLVLLAPAEVRVSVEAAQFDVCAAAVQ